MLTIIEDNFLQYMLESQACQVNWNLAVYINHSYHNLLPPSTNEFDKTLSQSNFIFFISVDSSKCFLLSLQFGVRQLASIHELIDGNEIVGICELG